MAVVTKDKPPVKRRRGRYPREFRRDVCGARSCSTSVGRSPMFPRSWAWSNRPFTTGSAKNALTGVSAMASAPKSATSSHVFAGR